MIKNEKTAWGSKRGGGMCAPCCALKRSHYIQRLFGISRLYGRGESGNGGGRSHTAAAQANHIISLVEASSGQIARNFKLSQVTSVD